MTALDAGVSLFTEIGLLFAAVAELLPLSPTSMGDISVLQREPHNSDQGERPGERDGYPNQILPRHSD